MEDYRKKGFLPEALVNFVALLGWNPGDEREIFQLEDLVREFSLERVVKSGAVFNVEKLNWMNFEHLRKKPDAQVLVMLKEFLSGSAIGHKDFSDEYLLNVIGAMRERVSFVKDFLDKSPYFFHPPDHYDPHVVKKRWKKETPGHLKMLIAEFLQLQNLGKADYEAALHRVAEKLKVKNADLIHALRLATSGVGEGPGLYDILFILGQKETISRISSAIEALGHK